MQNLKMDNNDEGTQQIIPLGKLCQKIRGVSYSKDEVIKSPATDYLPILRANNIEDDELNYDELVYVPKARVATKQLLQKGDVVIAMSSGSKKIVGKGAQLKKDWSGSFGAFCGVLRPNLDKVNQNYFGYFFSSATYRNYISEVSAGTNINNLKNEHFESIAFPLPSLKEQQIIATELDNLLPSIKINKTRLKMANTLVKKFRQTILSAAITGILTKDWRTKNGDYEWERTTLQSVIKEKPRNGYSPKAVDYPTQIKSLTLTATTSGIFNPQHFKYIDEKIPQNSHLWLMPGDILIQRANSYELVGASAIYDGKEREFIYPDLMMKVKANDRALTEFIYYVLSSQQTKTYFQNNATGTAGNMPKINQGIVMNTPLFLPNIAEQKEIIKRVSRYLDVANEVETQMEKAEAVVSKLTKAVLAKTFNDGDHE